MDRNELIKQITQEVMKQILNNETPSAPINTGDTMTKEQYPLGDKVPEKIMTPTGKKLSDLTMDKMISGELKAEDMRISPETLEYQAQVAESVNRDAFSRNLRRAGELIAVPDNRILEIYNALRPYRSTKAELYAIADELENKYGCKVNAEFVREAADVYETRGRLKKD